MTIRDPRSRVTSPLGGREPREQTQSLSLETPPEEAAAHPSLALGTREAQREQTSVASPNARHRDRSGSKPPTAGDREEAEGRLGEVLGTYRLDELLGKGGMGYVYRAEHVKLGREVALKLLRSDYSRRRDAVLRFFQEAKTVNRVRHRNIVDVTDFVELDDGTTFIIMELLRGQSLGKWARAGVDLPRALAVLVQICDGLGAAHAVGVIHRDLKPDNVIVVPTSDGEMVKLLDFGVAKLVNREDEDIAFQTAAGSVIGTPAYMSPEQAGGMAIDHRSDIYSLGAIMYELFCGQPMFRGRSFGEFVRKHLTELPILPRQTPGGASLDPRLEALIMRCVAKDPNERFGHILELRDGLLHLLGHDSELNPSGESILPPGGTPIPPVAQLPSRILPLPPGMVTTQPTPPPAPPVGVRRMPAPSLSLSEVPDRTSLWPVWLGGGVLAIALGIIGAIWYGQRGQAPHGVASAPASASEPAAAPTPPSSGSGGHVFELRFDSLPSASVFAEGHAAELCRTPCAHSVDLTDGGATDQRTFVLHADGYRDRTVVVDLSSSKHDYSITLEQVVPVAATPPPSLPTAPASAEHHQSPGRHGKARSIDKIEDDSDDASDAPAGEAKTAREPAEPGASDSKTSDDNPPQPVESKPAGSKPKRRIDPTDTLDPFHRRPS
jgi:serine/threonine-protein kinase